MKTLWIIDHYSSEPKYGGYTRQYNFARGLGDRGINVVVIASSFSHFTHTYISEEECFTSEISSNVHFVYVHSDRYETNTSSKRFLGMLSFVRNVLKLKKTIAEKYGRPDWIVCSSPHILTWPLGRKLAQVYKAHYNIEIRDFWPLELRSPDDSLLKKAIYSVFDKIETIAFKKAEHIICTLPYGKDYCADFKKPGEDKFVIIGQPLDCAGYDKSAEENWELIPETIRNFVNGSFYCVFSGYIMKYEGVLQMIEAAEKIQKDNLPVKFVFVGSGDEEETLIRFIKEHELTNTIIGGRIKKEAIPALLSKSSICLAYLFDEESPEMFKYGMSKNKINEYLYSGAITIMGFTDDRNEISGCGGGFTFQPSENRFYELIKQVYNMSEENRREMGNKAREYILKEHGIESLCEKYYKEILS